MKYPAKCFNSVKGINRLSLKGISKKTKSYLHNVKHSECVCVCACESMCQLVWEYSNL